MVDLVGWLIPYILVGTFFLMFTGDYIAGDDEYLAFGLIMFWPLFFIKAVVLTVVRAFKWVVRSAPKWTVVPMSIFIVLKRTGRELVGLPKAE